LPLEDNQEQDLSLTIYCIRQHRTISNPLDCRQCSHRRRCRAFTLFLEPELPFRFKLNGESDSIFDAQNEIKNTLDALFSGERVLLEKMALSLLPGVKERTSAIVRLKMYELLQHQGE
jgi:hypothetical protein